jgi:hypothetical protein
VADTDPVGTLRRAAEAAPKVLPPWIATMVVEKISFALESPMRVSDLRPFYGQLAAEVLALAEQQTRPSVSREQLIDHLTRIRVDNLTPVDGMVSVNAESMADAIAVFLRDNGIEVK